jgi:subtilisin family serine protease
MGVVLSRTLYGFTFEVQGRDARDRVRMALPGWTVTLSWYDGQGAERRSQYVAVDPEPRPVVPSAAFARAQELAARVDGAVEPILRAHVLEGAGDWEPGTEDRAWTVAEFGVQKARQTHSVTGQGVRVGHPDTGTTRHPALERRRIFDGADLVSTSDLPGPIDEARSFFGHGTGTSSVLLAEADPAKPEDTVHGVAPGAELVVYRVANTVALALPWDRARLARAIDLAVEAGCQVISISMGWAWGSTALRRAVANAYDAGVIVVAAAGQIHPDFPPPWVVAPARYPQVIAAAACHRSRKGCSWSARGYLVGATAPGSGVWRAGWASDRKTPNVERSWGTSFATAHIAGVAALWIERWRNDPRFTSRTGGDRVALFEWALSAAQLQDPDGASPGKWGAGIVDAEAVLGVDLPPVGARVRTSKAAPAEGSPEALAELAVLLREHLEEDGWGEGELEDVLGRALAGEGVEGIEAAVEAGGAELVATLESEPDQLQLLVRRVSEERHNVRKRGADDGFLAGASPGLKASLGY